MKPFPLVVEFMRAFGQRVPDSPEMPDEATKTLRARLDKEERRELDEAKDLAEYLDAVCDSLYVTMGAAAAAGFTSETIAEAFWEVHRSNMSKLWTGDEVEAMTGTVFENCYDVTRANVEEWVDRCLIVKRKDGKVIKSPGYSPANLWPIIRRDSAVKESSTTDHSEDSLEKVAKLEAANKDLVEALEWVVKMIKTTANHKSKVALSVILREVDAILAKHKGAA